MVRKTVLLAREPYELVIAKDGQEAYDLALSSRPDLIVLDVIMPKLTGFEVCRMLREHEQTKATPILLVTTRGEAENVEKGYAAGCNDYITKPLNNVEFVTKVRDHLTR